MLPLLWIRYPTKTTTIPPPYILLTNYCPILSCPSQTTLRVICAFYSQPLQPCLHSLYCIVTKVIRVAKSNIYFLVLMFLILHFLHVSLTSTTSNFLTFSPFLDLICLNIQFLKALPLYMFPGRFCPFP